MDTSISQRIADFRAPPPYPKLEAFEEKPAQGFTPERLDELDGLVVRLIATDRLSEFMQLTLEERIYVSLASNKGALLTFLNLTIAQAIDRLGWVDASAMVARWRNRRA